MALVLTLLIVAMLTVVVVGFNAATRTEQMASRNYGLQAGASAMAETAVGEALALLNRATATNYLSQPGRMLLGGTQEVLLSSASLPAGTVNTNLNALLPIQTAGAVNPDFFSVPWVTVQGQAGGATRAIGRYAFWIDDNGSRVNLNVASPTVRTNFLPTNNRPLWAGSIVQGTGIQPNQFATDLSNRLTATRSNQPWGYFFTPRQLISLRGGITNVQQLGYRTAGMNPNRPAPSYPLADGAPLNLNAGGDNGFLETVRSGFAGSESSLLETIDQVIDRQLSGERYEALFNQRNGFAHKYGRDVLRQIVVNLNDFTLPTGSAETTGQTTVTGAAFRNDDEVPQTVAGLRPFPYLNEIVYRVAQTTNGVPEWSAVELQIWIGFELVNPYEDPWGLLGRVMIERWGGLPSITVEYDTGEGKATAEFSTTPWGDFDDGRLAVYVNNNLPGNSFATDDGGGSFSYAFEWQVEKSNLPEGASNAVVKSVRIEPGVITWRQWYDAPETVRDWAQEADFGSDAVPGNHFQFDEIPMVAGPAIGPGNYGQRPPPENMSIFFSGPAARGIAKNDPRVRSFPEAQGPLPAWYPVGGDAPDATTLGANNSTVDLSSGTGIAGLPNDNPPASSIVTEHPDFNEGLTNRLAYRPYADGFDLSKVHTGLQWRTLQLRAQDAAEGSARFVPDWALLGVFAAPNAAAPVAPVKINVNAVPFPAADAEANKTNLAIGSNGVLRVVPFVSLLSGNTTTNGSNAVLQGIPFDAAFPAAGADSYLAAATNMATMRFGTSWAARRAGDLNGRLPENAYLMPAEVLEVQGMYRTTVAESVNEGRVRGFYEALSTHSDTFTIFAVGQALDAQGRSTGEQRLRVTAEKATNSTGVVQFRPVLTEFVPSP